VRSNPAPKWARGWWSRAKGGDLDGGGGSLCRPANVSMMYFTVQHLTQTKREKNGVSTPTKKKGNTRLTGHQTDTNLNKMAFSCSVFIDSATQPYCHTPILYHFALFTYIAN